jgi:hypothetical protein
MGCPLWISKLAVTLASLRLSALDVTERTDVESDPMSGRLLSGPSSLARATHRLSSTAP